MRNDELKMQAEFFQWHWNTFPDERGLLHANNNNSYNAIKGAMNRAIGVVRGVADLEYNTMGTTIFIEMKTPEGHQTPDQRRFQQLIESQGFRYEIIRSVDAGKALIVELQQTRKEYEQWKSDCWVPA